LVHVAPPSAPLRPTAVWCWSDAPFTQALSTHPASHPSKPKAACRGPRLRRTRDRPGLPSAAPDGAVVQRGLDPYLPFAFERKHEFPASPTSEASRVQQEHRKRRMERTSSAVFWSEATQMKPSPTSVASRVQQEHRKRRMERSSSAVFWSEATQMKPRPTSEASRVQQEHRNCRIEKTSSAVWSGSDKNS